MRAPRVPFPQIRARDFAWRFVCAAAFGRLFACPSLLDDVKSQPETVWPYVVRLADTRLVTPAVWLGVSSAGFQSALPADVVRYLETIYALNMDRNARLLRQLDEVIATLNAERIVPMLLKGAAYLKLAVHADSGARILSDLDMLVPSAELEAAAAALAGAGYRSLNGSTPSDHHLAPRARNDRSAAVELHWKVVESRAQAVLTTAEVWERARSIESGALRFRVLSPPDAILHCFAHAQIADRRDATFSIDLRSVTDLLALDRHYGRSLDWGALFDKAVANGFDAELKRFVFIAGRIAAFDVGQPVAFDRACERYYAVCRSAIRFPWLAPIFSAIHRLTRSELRARYGPAGFWMTNAYRMGRIATFSRRLLSRLIKRVQRTTTSFS